MRPGTVATLRGMVPLSPFFSLPGTSPKPRALRSKGAPDWTALSLGCPTPVDSVVAPCASKVSRVPWEVRTMGAVTQGSTAGEPCDSPAHSQDSSADQTEPGTGREWWQEGRARLRVPEPDFSSTLGVELRRGLHFDPGSSPPSTPEPLWTSSCDECRPHPPHG